jgi:bacteriocin-like protein
MTEEQKTETTEDEVETAPREESELSDETLENVSGGSGRPLQV